MCDEITCIVVSDVRTIADAVVYGKMEERWKRRILVKSRAKVGNRVHK